MMNIRKTAALATALALALSVCKCGVAVEFVPGNLPGTLITLDDGTPAMIIMGNVTPDELMNEEATSVYVAVQRENGDCALCVLIPSATTLLDAIVDTGLGEAEEAAWGYNIGTMDDIRASDQENGAWWDISYQDPETGLLTRLTTGVQDTLLSSSPLFMFTFSR